MKLETKLGLTSAVLILAMLSSTVAVQLRLRDARRTSAEMSEARGPFLLEAREAGAHITGSVRALESYLLLGKTAATADLYHNECSSELSELDGALRQMDALAERLKLGPDRDRLASIRQGAEQLKQAQSEIEGLRRLRDLRNTPEAETVQVRQVLELDRSLSRTVSELTKSQRAEIEGEENYLDGEYISALWTLWGGTLLTALSGGVISTLLGRHIVSGVDAVARRANAIASGDLTGDALQLERRDQVGTLSEAMNRMQASLGGIIGTVVDTAGSLTGSAASMREASDQIHRRMDEQSQQTQHAATAMQEMSASIAEVSRHTQSAAETARSAAQTARDGGTIVKQMLASMHQIATSVSDTGVTVGMLGQESKRISQIVTVIDEIARKTNLLALNAAIEAARAGEQGRGFAVVAGEVRRLAESTAEATGEIGAMIAAIQDRTRSAISSMEQGTGIVRDGVVTTTQAGEALERIIGMAERVDRMITQIAIAAAQQAMAADQSSASLDSIHSLSNANVSEMATTTAGIEGLRGTAFALERQVDRFLVQGSPLERNRESLHMVGA